MSPFGLLFCLVILCGSGLASDVPFVFEEGTDLASYSSIQLEEASSTSQDLVGVPPVTSPHDNEVLEIPIIGSGGMSEGKSEKEVIDLKNELNKKVEPDNSRIRDEAVKYPGDLTIEQIREIYFYLKFGDLSKNGWKYVRDPRGIDTWNYANESLKIGDNLNCVGRGDCDDFAILMAAFVESIGGATRIILAKNNIGGHVYTEVYLGQLNDTSNQVEEIIRWLQQEDDTDKIYGHIDTNTKEVWLNLDWGPDEKGNAHPGGPLFQGDIHYVLRIRDKYKLIPLRMPETINRPPRLISLTPDKNSPQEAGSVVTWIAKATDHDNDQIRYCFFQDSYPVTKWTNHSSWVWTTTEADIGDNQIEVRVRDGKHAGPNSFDSNAINNFSIYQPLQQYEIDFVSPREGDLVPNPVDVRGKFSGKLPKGQYMWVVASSFDNNGLWWPQGEQINPIDGLPWKVQAWLGDENDVGNEYIISIILIDENDNNKYWDYMKTGEETGDWPGNPLPASADIISTITVTRE